VEYLKEFLSKCESIHREAINNPEGDVFDSFEDFLYAYSEYKDALTARTLAIVSDGTCHDERG